MLRNKPIVFLALMSAAIFTTNAQYVTGVEVGIGRSWFGYDWWYHKPTIETDICYSFGTFYKERRDRFINIGFEIEYQFKSFKIDQNCSSRGHYSKNEMDFKLGYLNFYFTPEIEFGKKCKFLLSIGPYLGILLHSNKKGSGKYFDYTPQVSVKEWSVDGSAKYEFYTRDFGVKATAGMEFPISSRVRLFTHVGYKIGVNIAAGGSICATSKLIPQIFDVSLGIGYKINNSNVQKLTTKLFE